MAPHKEGVPRNPGFVRVTRSEFSLFSLPKELRAVHLGDVFETCFDELGAILDRQIYPDVSLFR